MRPIHDGVGAQLQIGSGLAIAGAIQRHRCAADTDRAIVHQRAAAGHDIHFPTRGLKETAVAFTAGGIDMGLINRCCQSRGIYRSLQGQGAVVGDSMVHLPSGCIQRILSTQSSCQLTSRYIQFSTADAAAQLDGFIHVDGASRCIQSIGRCICRQRTGFQHNLSRSRFTQDCFHAVRPIHDGVGAQLQIGSGLAIAGAIQRHRCAADTDRAIVHQRAAAGHDIHFPTRGLKETAVAFTAGGIDMGLINRCCQSRGIYRSLQGQGAVVGDSMVHLPSGCIQRILSTQYSCQLACRYIQHSSADASAQFDGFIHIDDTTRCSQGLSAGISSQCTAGIQNNISRSRLVQNGRHTVRAVHDGVGTQLQFGSGLAIALVIERHRCAADADRAIVHQRAAAGHDIHYLAGGLQKTTVSFLSIGIDMSLSNHCCQSRGIKQAFQSQLSAVVDSTGKRVCFTVGHLQGACTCVGEGIGKACHRDFQCTAVKYNLPSAQSLGIIHNKHTALDFRTAGVTVGRLDSQFTCSILGQAHATRQFTPHCVVGHPDVILGTVDQHALRCQITCQFHRATGLISENHTDSVAVSPVEFMLLPVNRTVYIPDPVPRSVIPGSLGQRRVVQVKGVIHPAEVIDRPHSAADGDMAYPVGRCTHPTEQYVATIGSQPFCRIQLQGNASIQSQGAVIQCQRSGGRVRGGNIDDKGAIGRQGQCAVHRRILSAEA